MSVSAEVGNSVDIRYHLFSVHGVSLLFRVTKCTESSFIDIDVRIINLSTENLIISRLWKYRNININ